LPDAKQCAMIRLHSANRGEPKMDVWTALGSGSLGLVIGWLVWTFVVRAKTLTLKALSTLCSIAAGGTILAVWHGTGTGTAGSKPEVNAYFIGLLVAVLVLGLLNYDPPADAD